MDRIDFSGLAEGNRKMGYNGTINPTG